MTVTVWQIIRKGRAIWCMLLAAEENSNKTKRQSNKWGKIFANHIFDRRLISKIYKKLLQSNSKTNKQTKKNQIKHLKNLIKAGRLRWWKRRTRSSSPPINSFKLHLYKVLPLWGPPFISWGSSTDCGWQNREMWTQGPGHHLLSHLRADRPGVSTGQRGWSVVGASQGCGVCVRPWARVHLGSPSSVQSSLRN